MALIALSVATLQVLSINNRSIAVTCSDGITTTRIRSTISAPKRDACAFVTRTNLGNSQADFFVDLRVGGSLLFGERIMDLQADSSTRSLD
jgi:hypothetical protein